MQLAVTGIACLLPGAHSPDQFWRNLVEGVDSRTEGDAATFGIDPRDAGGWGDERHRITCTRGGFVTGAQFSPDQLSPDGFLLPPDYLTQLDQVFQWPLHVARAALRDSGVRVGEGVLARTGAVFGNYSFPTRRSGARSLPLIHGAVTAGLRAAGLPAPARPDHDDPARDLPENLWAAGFPARVLGAALGLGGPQFALDAACSSALYSLKLAGDYLATGRADLMLAGAVCAADPVLIHLSFSDLQAYPANGVSQPFDRRSTGIVTGQGAGMFVLKRLADAQRDRDRIYAVVDGVGLTSDGAGTHLLSPSAQGQRAAYERAYAASGVDPADVDYLECHATGTQLGDTTELRGLTEFFTAHGAAPPLGSVKANLGHLLTVAGFSSMLKVILALRHGQIPPTIGITDPMPGGDVVRTATAWPETGHRRRGAVSAFGFGGTNAHVVLSAPPASDDADAPGGPDARPATPPLVITGMSAHVGGLDGLARFERAVHGGQADVRPLPEHRWHGLDRHDGPARDLDPDALRGAFIDTIDTDVLALRVPPADLGDFNPQQLLLHKVAGDALADAGYPRPGAPAGGAPPPRNVAVVVAMELEPRTHAHRGRFDIGRHVRAECDRAGVRLTGEQLDRLEAAARESVHDPLEPNAVLSYIGNLMASRISATHNFTGPSFTLSADSASPAQALEVAALLLLDPAIEAVLVGAVDLAGGAENVLARAARAAPPGAGEAAAGLSFGDGSGGWRVGEGSCAVVLTRPDAVPPGQRRYAQLDAVAVRHPVPARAGRLPHGPDAATVAAAARDALTAAGVDAAAVGYVEAHAGGLGDRDTAEAEGLSGVYASDGAPTCALGSVSALVGDTQTAAALLALVKTALCLHHAYLPATPGWRRPAPAYQAALERSAFHVHAASRPWLRDTTTRPRVAAVSVLGSGGTAAHLVLSGADTRATRRTVDWDETGGHLLLPVGADTPERLAGALRHHHELVADPTRPAAATVRAAVAGRPPTRYTAVLVAPDRAGLLHELESAARDLPAVLATDGTWATPAGSYCTARPLGAGGKVAFVFPGAFTSYPGQGGDLFRHFPALLARLEQTMGRPSEQSRDRRLYPRALAAPSRRELMTHEAALLDDIPATLATGTNFASLSSALLRDLLGLRPHGAFGYSLGESSMLFAMGVWDDTARDDHKLAATPLFQDRLRGPKRTVRERWALPDDLPDDRVWATLVLLADADEVRAAVGRYDRVFLTHVNTPREVVVAGDPDQCQALVATLGCRAARAPANHVMHCALVDGETDQLAELNSYPVVGDGGGAELLSADDYAPLEDFGRDAISRRVARTLRSTVDFARLARTAHDRGFRYFVEVGPGATCTRWVADTLGDADHVAISVDRRGASGAAALSQALARLVSHGLPVDLGVLFPPEPPAAADANPARSLRRQVVVGGPSVSERLAAAAAPVLAATPTPTEVPRDVPSDVPRAVPDEAVGDEEVPELVPATLTDAVLTDAITFDGEPFVYLPAHAGSPAGHAADLVRGHAPEVLQLQPARPTTVTPHPGWGAQPGTTDRSAQTTIHRTRPQVDAPDRAHLVRALRDQAARTHESVMRIHEAIQQGMLARLEARQSGSDDQAVRSLRTGPLGAPAESTGQGGRGGVVWDADDLLEFARGRVGDVFGPEFAPVDELPVRVRLPEPPYLFVSRVTELRATPGRFERSFIRTEYDVPAGAWYSVDGLVPCAVTIEAGQSDLLLISYLGIDFRNRGERVYRLLDSTLVFHGDLPTEGQTLRYDITIDRFVWDGDKLLFFFGYACYADGELILELKEACAGFFTAEELGNSAGIVFSDADRKRRAAFTRSWFKPLARNGCTRLGPNDLAALAEGRTAEVFGPDYDQRADDGTACNPSLRLPTAQLRMIDEIPVIDRLGGPRGLGAVTAVKRLDPDSWYFTCHFSDDPVLAGSLVAEGGVQILQTYALYLGMHLCLPDARFQSVPGLETRVKVRGQVTPATRELRYEVEITDLRLLPRPTVVADIVVYDGDKPMISMTNFGIQLREKPGTPYRPGPGGVPVHLGRRNRHGEAAMINELHLAHAAKGDLATAMGPEFEIYGTRRAPHIPNGDFKFVDRIMRLDGTRGVFTPGATMVTEYDSSPDAWYYREPGSPGMPNCVLMETSLQAAVLLGYYMGATLDAPEQEFSIRNLDGQATLLADPDLRGRTVRQHTTLLSSQATAGAVLQRFRYELSADGEPFYAGESLFGYFTAEALASTVGLDAGAAVRPWLHTHEHLRAAGSVRALDPRAHTAAGPGRLHLPGGHLDLLGQVESVPDGGAHGRGYLLGHRRIDPADWYFDCHFHRDPVMPGSLGVEAAIQALQLHVIDTGLAEGVPDPRFAVPRDIPMTWKYRGQILRADRDMTVDVHVKEVRRDRDRLVVIGDANLWKRPGLRIYELTDVAVEVRPRGQETS